MLTDDYKKFDDSLNHGDEYTALVMKIDSYNGIDFEMDELIYRSTIRQYNKNFKNDEVHKALVKKVSKAKKELRNYEFDKNH